MRSLVQNVFKRESEDVPVFPRHSPFRIANDGIHDRRKAPSIKYIATSAVASSTAPGVLEMKTPEYNVINDSLNTQNISLLDGLSM